MRYLYFPFRIRNLPRFIGIFLLGILVGGVVALFLQGKSYDRLYVEKKEVESYVVELQNTIERLESIQQQQTHNFLVKEISVETDLTDPVKSVEIRSEVNKLLKDLIGENVESINPELIINILDNRIIVVGDKQYKLTVRSLIISKILVVNTSVSEFSEQSTD